MKYILIFTNMTKDILTEWILGIFLCLFENYVYRNAVVVIGAGFLIDKLGNRSKLNFCLFLCNTN
jgi:hypothetical protein